MLKCISRFIDNKIEQRLDRVMETRFFKNEIQKIIHAYIVNVSDDKSDYLKRYLEVRLNCLSVSVEALSKELKEHIVNLNKPASRMKDGKKKRKDCTKSATSS